MLKFGGFSTEDKGRSIEEEFETVYDDTEVIMQSFKTFMHEEGELSFNYKYMVQVVDMSEFDDNNSQVVVELHMVVSPRSLCDKQREDVLYSVGMEDEEDYELDFKDILESGLSVRCGIEFYELNDAEDFMELDAVQDGLKAIANIYKLADNMRGFTLDQPWNMIGTTGWDTIEHLVLGTELFKF